jgi:hypothetical protein
MTADEVKGPRTICIPFAAMRVGTAALTLLSRIVKKQPCKEEKPGGNWYNQMICNTIAEAKQLINHNYTSFSQTLP